jgi:hypothetical protein
MERSECKIGMMVDADLRHNGAIPAEFRTKSQRCKVKEIIGEVAIIVISANMKETGTHVKYLKELKNTDRVSQKSIDSATERMHKSFRLRDTLGE